MTPLGFVQSGRSGKNYYLNKDGEEREFMVENPCSRLSYYSIGEVKKMWNDEKFKIYEKLGPWDEVEHLFDAYFRDMKKVYLDHMMPVTGLFAFGLSLAYIFTVWDKIPFVSTLLSPSH